MNPRMMICVSAIALAGALAAAEPAQAALTLIAVGGGGGGGANGAGAPGAPGVISESGTSGSDGGAGGTGGLGGAGSDGGGGAGGFGGGGGGGVFGAGGGGGYSGGGGGVNGGGGGGSYLNPALRNTIETPDFNGMSGVSASDGYVIVGLTVFNYTGTIVEYTIPTSQFYYVAAVGAQGGGFGGGGYGAGVGGSVFLDAGTELNIVVGGAGAFNGQDGGGGGGSFVWDPTAIPAQPAVPEPSTWAMTLIGFAGLGFAGWRTKRLASRISPIARP